MMPACSSCTRSGFLGLAFVLALCPPLIKLYETSYWFRQGDPSQYDHVKEWFTNTPDLVYAKDIDDPKELMRLYFFIVPYVLSALALAVANLLPKSTTAPQKTVIRLVGRSMLRKTLAFPRCLVWLGSPLRISVGEIFGVIAFLIINFGTVVVRVMRSYALGSAENTFLVDPSDAGQEPMSYFSWPAREVWAKTLGVISIVNLGWYLLMPVGRRSVLLEVLGVSWERAIKYHRWVGVYSIVLMAAHGGMYVAIWNQGNKDPVYDPEGVMLKHNLVPWYGCNDSCNDDQWIRHRKNMYGLSALFLVLTMGFFAMPWFRRHKFEWFYYIHHLFLPLIVLICLHYDGAILYLVPGLAMYSVDKLLGLLAYWKSGNVMTKQVSCQVLEITVPLGIGVQYQAGQYVFLNVPSVSCWEWHPYSVTSAPHVHGSQLTFHIKKNNSNAAGGSSTSWANRVFEQAQQSSLEGLRVRLDGFYGQGIDDQLAGSNKDAVVLVAGGIGVTPLMSMALELLETRPNLPVTLLWVTRSVEEFHMFARRLCKALDTHGTRLTVKVWITLHEDDAENEANTTAAVAAAADEEKAIAPTTSTITHKSMKGLTEADQCALVLNVIRSPSPYDVQAIRAPAHPLVMDRSAFSPFWHVLIIAIAMAAGMNAYVGSYQVQDDQDVPLSTPDEMALYQLSWVCGAIVVVVVLAMALRFARSQYVQYQSRKLQNNGRVGCSLSMRDKDVVLSRSMLSKSKSMYQDDNNNDKQQQQKQQQKEESNETSSEGSNSSKGNNQGGNVSVASSKFSVQESVDESRTTAQTGAKTDTKSQRRHHKQQQQQQQKQLSMQSEEDENEEYFEDEDQEVPSPIQSMNSDNNNTYEQTAPAEVFEIVYCPWAHQEEKLLMSMLEGRIGCRPNVRQELEAIASRTVANNSKKDDDSQSTHETMEEQDNNHTTDDLKDIQVLACGPKSLVASVQAYCNKPGVTWWSFFDFVEEDWEW